MKVPSEFLRFIDSERVSPRTRELLEQRMAGPAATGNVLNARQELTLRALLARVVPQVCADSIDLAGFVLARLATGKGDGWRYDVLPADALAYREGLDRLGAKRFAELGEAAQDALILALAAVKGSVDARWFEEVRGDAVAAYVAHPATLARLGYSGIGVGGANTDFKGFVTIGPNQRESWEPLPSKTNEVKA
jgi:hypothetical protein